MKILEKLSLVIFVVIMNDILILFTLYTFIINLIFINKKYYTFIESNLTIAIIVGKF